MKMTRFLRQQVIQMVQKSIMKTDAWSGHPIIILIYEAHALKVEASCAHWPRSWAKSVHCSSPWELQ